MRTTSVWALCFAMGLWACKADSGSPNAEGDSDGGEQHGGSGDDADPGSSGADGGRQSSRAGAGSAGRGGDAGEGSGGEGSGGSDARAGNDAQGGSGGSLAEAGTNSEPTDGGEPDTGTGDPDASSGDCAFVLCDDFEGDALDARWSMPASALSAGNSIGLQSDMVSHGNKAVRFHAVAQSKYAMMFIEDLPAALRHHYFGRVYFYATDFPDAQGGHTAYITSSNTLDGFPFRDHHLEVASFVSQQNGPVWQMTYWQGDGPEYIGSGGHIPQAQWFCLEWEFNDDPDQIAIWVDGSASPNGAEFRNINNNSANLLGEMTTLGIGFRTWHEMGAPDIDVYMDDLALDTERVGCR